MKKLLLGLVFLAITGLRCAFVIDDSTRAQSSHKDVIGGALHSPFGTSGAYTTVSGTIIRAIKVLKSGNILLVGADSSGSRVELLKADGSGLVTTWGTSGVYQGVASGTFYAAEELDNGKILLAGDDASVARVEQLDAMGALDTANFGSSGIYASASGATNTYAMKVLDSGKIVIAGTDGFDWYVEQLTSAGAIDTANFGSSGIYTTSSGVTIYAMEVLGSSGKIVIAGGDGSDWRVEQLTSAGVLDTANFGSSGIYTGHTDSKDVRSIAVKPTGEIVLAGTSDNGWRLEQLTSAGLLDTANFGSSGVYNSATATASGDIPYSLIIQGDGKILVGGYDASAGWRLERLGTGGALDLDFGGGDGIYVSATATATGDELFAMALHPVLGRILLGGDDGAAWRVEQLNNNIDPLKHPAGYGPALIGCVVV